MRLHFLFPRVSRPSLLRPFGPLSLLFILFLLLRLLVFSSPFKLSARLVFPRSLFYLFYPPFPPLSNLLLGRIPPMWKPRFSPRSESKTGSDSNHLRLSELGLLGRSKRKTVTPSSGECHIRLDSVPDLRLSPPMALVQRARVSNHSP